RRVVEAVDGRGGGLEMDGQGGRRGGARARGGGHRQRAAGALVPEGGGGRDPGQLGRAGGRVRGQRHRGARIERYRGTTWCFVGRAAHGAHGGEEDEGD